MFKLKERNEIALPEQVEYLEAERDKVQLSILEAQAKLDEAKAKQRLTGDYMNPEEFIKLKRIVREQTDNLHLINRQIKSINRRIAHGDPKATLFQLAAKKILTPEIYAEIERIAYKNDS